MSITAVVNQKGGVGKTTVTLGIASTLSAAGKSVLVVDLDPQANATTGFGIFVAEQTIDAAMLDDTPGSIRSIIQPAQWPETGTGAKVAVVPGTPAMSSVEHQLVSDVVGAQDRLATALDGVSEDFDEVLIDCPPSLGLLTVNALFAADRAIVVTEPAAWSADGVQQIINNVERIARRRAGNPILGGVVVNRVGRTRDASFWSESLAEQYPNLVVGPKVKLRAVVAEAAAQSLPLYAMTRSGSEEAVSEFAELTEVLFPTTVDITESGPLTSDSAAPASAAPSPTAPGSAELSMSEGAS